MHTRAILCALCLVCTACAQAAPVGRMAVPDFVTCDRDRLTSLAGEVRVFERADDADRIVIATDWDTIEEVTVFHPEPESAGNLYRVRGEPMTPGDWPRIEQRGVVVPGTRAVAWVCEDPAHPVIVDWQPAQQEG